MDEWYWEINGEVTAFEDTISGMLGLLSMEKCPYEKNWYTARWGEHGAPRSRNQPSAANEVHTRATVHMWKKAATKFLSLSLNPCHRWRTTYMVDWCSIMQLCSFRCN